MAPTVNNKPDNRSQGHNHQPVRQRVLQAEQVREADRHYTPKDQD